MNLADKLPSSLPTLWIASETYKAAHDIVCNEKTQVYSYRDARERKTVYFVLSQTQTAYKEITKELVDQCVCPAACLCPACLSPSPASRTRSSLF